MRGLSVFLVLLAVLNSGFAQPTDPREDKKRVDAELAQTGALLETASAEAQTALVRLAELNQALPVARTHAAEARGSVAAAENLAATRQQEADAAAVVTERADQRYDQAADRVHDGRVRLGRFAAQVYQGGEVAQFNALLGSDGPAQLIQRVSYARKVAEAKKTAVDGLVGALWDAKQVSNEATLARNAAGATAAASRQAVLDAQLARAEAERSERELTQTAQRQQEAVTAAENYRAEVLQRHEEVKRESERVGAELRAWESAQPGQSVPVFRPGARLLMPVRGWKSSDFGQRYDPYYHVWQLHAGMDIAADGGDPIYAAADGKVASAGWRGGYGNYTCVSHGNYQGQNLSTCYAHQSRILVDQGQWLSQGQLIGKVGTTGASTGDHLHFEVRLDGDPTNPEDWLPGCLC